MPFQPTANYLSLTLRNLSYSVFEANVLTIPSYMLFAFNVSTSTIVCTVHALTCSSCYFSAGSRNDTTNAS
jgi:hypothetical protein